MDVRVFPFAFPPIKGGAQGGDSPTPTPPPVINYYDFADATFGVYFFTEDGDWQTYTGTGTRLFATNLKIDGIVALDTSDVAQILITSGMTTLTADGVEMIEDTDIIDAVAAVAYTGLDVSLSSYGRFYRAGFTKDNWNSKMGGKAAGGQAFLKFEAFDKDGNLLQTKTWTAVVS